MHRAQPLAVLLALTIGSVVSAAEHGPSVQQIAENIDKVYATCRTYRDSATVTRLRVDGSIEPGDHPRRQVKTAFKRGGVLRFEYRASNVERRAANAGDETVLILWASGDELQTFPRDAGKALLQQERSDPNVILRTWTGITEGASTTIPPLLLRAEAKKLDPEPGFTSLSGARSAPDIGFASMYGDAERLKNEAIGDIDCYVLRKKMEAVNFEDKSTFSVVKTFWIDSHFFLIRRAETEMFQAITRIEYLPAVDIELETAELEFAPPR